MPSLLRKNLDYAGGLIITGSDNVFVNGYGIVRVNDTVASHSGHNTTYMISGSSKVFANGRAVCRVGDLAACGHSGTGGSQNTTTG
jgi:uncharacterized Zn-binding protein involved in type VI secretion